MVEGSGKSVMLVTLLRVFTWLAVAYAVVENVAMVIGAFGTSETPWSLIAAWFNPLSFDNWRFEGRLIAPALASHFSAGWLSARR
jgi:hypothetical protein